MLRSILSSTAAPAASHAMAVPLSRSDRDWRRRFDDLAAILGGWVERGRTRRALALLDERQLRDLGLSSTDQRRESAKPFWQS